MDSNGTYRFIRSQDGSAITVGDEVMEREEAFALMGIERTLHVAGGWETWSCDCSMGFHAQRDGTCRQVHIYEEDDLLELGVLAPASLPVLGVSV